MYTEEQQSRLLVACDSWERALFSTFLFTEFREQEVMYLFWKDLNPKLRTVRVLSKPDLKFYRSGGKNAKCRYLPNWEGRCFSENGSKPPAVAPEQPAYHGAWPAG